MASSSLISSKVADSGMWRSTAKARCFSVRFGNSVVITFLQGH
jgi:hypothetical protein